MASGGSVKHTSGQTLEAKNDKLLQNMFKHRGKSYPCVLTEHHAMKAYWRSGGIKKVKLSLCLTKHHAMKAYWGVEVQLHAFFDLGTRWR
jgi:hypothetical protein